MKHLIQVADFVRGLRARIRFGELSRAPLRMLRLQLCGDTAEISWVARPPDVWDATLPRRERDRLASSQALQDAIALRGMLFAVLTDVQAGEFRAFRQSAREPPHLIITGRVTREPPAVLRVTSPVMRPKLYGLYFHLDDGVLRPLAMEDSSLQLMISA